MRNSDRADERVNGTIFQCLFRHALVSSSIEITMEFSFVGIQGRRERVIGSNRTVGGSSRETATAFPHTTQICDISSDRPPKLRNLSNDRFKSGTCNHLKLLFQAVSLT